MIEETETRTALTTEKTLGDVLDDVWDSREMIEALDELEAIDNPDEDAQHELGRLRAAVDECSDVSDWIYGETFIRDSYFEDYAYQLADELGLLPDDAPWPTSYIDWERAAAALQADYTSYTIEGETYWARA